MNPLGFVVMLLGVLLILSLLAPDEWFWRLDAWVDDMERRIRRAWRRWRQ